VRQLIYTGSYAVYGDREGAWVDEASPVAPANPNGQILCETEQVLLSASSDDMSVCILRLGGIYGPRRELVKYLVEWLVRPGNGEDATIGSTLMTSLPLSSLLVSTDCKAFTT